MDSTHPVVAKMIVLFQIIQRKWHEVAYHKEKVDDDDEEMNMMLGMKSIQEHTSSCHMRKASTFIWSNRKNLAFGFAASLVMHLQGLLTLLKFDGTPRTMILAIAGAGLEGILLISILSMLVSKGRRRVWRLALAFISSIIAIFFLFSDAWFMLRTGGERPDMWMLASAMKESKSLLQSELNNEPRKYISCLMKALAASIPASILVFQTNVNTNKGRLQSEATNSTRNRHTILGQKNKEQNKKKWYFFLTILAMMSGLYIVGAWMPIFHIIVCYNRIFLFSYCGPPGSEHMKWYDADQMECTPWSGNSFNETAPNVVLIMHESLSGEVMMANLASDKEHGKNPKMPFFNKMLHSDSEYFVFENVRTVSGDTSDALTAIQSGCLPLNHHTGRKSALSTTVGTEFKRRGFDTASFSSRTIKTLQGSKWWMLHEQLSTNYYNVISPDTTKEAHVNQAAQSDINTLKYFKKWLNEAKETKKCKENAAAEWLNSTNETMKHQENVTRPFFAQFYLYDSHLPMHVDKSVRKITTSRLDGMLMTLDKSIEGIFEALDKAGKLENTIVIGVGDHGEDYHDQSGSWPRLHEWSRNVLHSIAYMHVPRNISDSYPEIFQNLRYNTLQLTSTLDIFPTLMHFASGPQKDYPLTNENCVRGFDLLKSKIPSNRLAWSFPGVMTDFASSKKGNFAIHSGISSSLMYRYGFPKGFKGLEVVSYQNNIGSGRSNSETLTNGADTPLQEIGEWISVVEGVKRTSDETVLKNNGTMMTNFMKLLMDHAPKEKAKEQAEVSFKNRL